MAILRADIFHEIDIEILYRDIKNLLEEGLSRKKKQV